MNIFLGCANNVRALTVRSNVNKLKDLLDFSFIDCKLVRNSDFIYYYNSESQMWVMLKNRFESTEYEYFSQYDIHKCLSKHSGCNESEYAKVISLTKYEKMDDVISDFEQIQRSKTDERFAW